MISCKSIIQHHVLYLLLLAISITSCSSSKNSFSQSDFKKRKYRKGVFVDLRKKDDSKHKVLEYSTIQGIDTLSYIEKTIHTDLSAAITEDEVLAVLLNPTINVGFHSNVSTEVKKKQGLRGPRAFRRASSICLTPAVNPSNSRSTHWAAVTGFLCSLAGLFIAGVILGLMAVIFGIVALNAISVDPDRHAGKGFAIVALLVGFIAIGGALLVIATLH